MSFIKTELSQLQFNPFSLIGKEWFLITAGEAEKFNTMTASWGSVGHLWARDIFTCHIRPCRYTYRFAEHFDYYTVSFFESQYKQALTFCGSHSGEDCDKAKEAGLTPVELDGCVTFAEARMVFICKKLYTAPMQKDNFVSEDGLYEKFYGQDPLHKSYTAEIVACYVKN